MFKMAGGGGAEVDELSAHRGADTKGRFNWNRQQRAERRKRRKKRRDRQSGRTERKREERKNSWPRETGLCSEITASNLASANWLIMRFRGVLKEHNNCRFVFIFREGWGV